VRDVTPFTGADGVTRQHEYIFVPVLAEDGSVEAVAGSTRDITERMRGEAELREANEKLSRTNRELEQYAYITSHDLQEPLRMVGNYMELIERRASDLSEPLRRYVGHARHATERMQSLIRDLLAFARVGESGPFADVDLGAVVAQAVENLGAAIAQAQATVTVDRLPTVWGGEMILVLLFQNLIGNAIKFRAPDRPPTVQVSAARRDGGWTIAVRDNGIGIPTGQQQRIFEVFQRLHSQAEYAGTGIGLAICRKIAEQHRGGILVESVEGAGSTFSVVIGDAARP
ncbi:MAG: histidine kinase, partial [Planctomycetes bacterium]|nr:histidine kinase [Planctomycetota bacterium]